MRLARALPAAKIPASSCYLNLFPPPSRRRRNTKKWIGAYAAALGGVDTLVFAGGIGENCPAIRRRICAGLGFLGLELNPARNARNAPLISAAASPVAVRVIRTDEELMIARSVTRLLGLGKGRLGAVKK